MAQNYFINLKSEELRGAGAPNGFEINLADDATAVTFGGAVAALCNADLTSITTETTGFATDYALPYPAGTNAIGRFNMLHEASDQWYNAWLSDIKAGADPKALGDALKAGGILLPDIFLSADTVNVLISSPGAFGG